MFVILRKAFIGYSPSRTLLIQRCLKVAESGCIPGLEGLEKHKDEDVKTIDPLSAGGDKRSLGGEVDCSHAKYQ